ncbi:hypothetical protein [Geobacillus kaustophilus]|uniref:hypothetical protein n=1 Tax=Geobacillus kaustophilus TaxID=1462 RepID=UPI0005CCD1B8|nr:hypothetical protein [Geobacillus kaustophilus]
MSDLQKQMDKSREMLVAFIEELGKFLDHARQVASNMLNEMNTPILIKQYEKEIQRVEQLLKYTRHSKKHQKHEQYLKWLYKQVATLKKMQ